MRKTEPVAGMIGQRIVVVGVTSSGKTTLARQIGEILHIPHIEMDALYWGPDWTPLPQDELMQMASAALAGDRWVTDGNYRKLRPLIWPRADTIVWLDYPLPLVLWRLTTRTVRRIVRQEALWHGNRESWRGGFLSRDSLFLWALKSYGRHRRDYPQLFRQPEYAHLTPIRLRSPRQTAAWLTVLKASIP